MTRALTMLNESGDTTILWDEDRDDEMEAIIAKKMEEGVAFFIIEPRFFGFLPPKRTPLQRAEDARKHRALSIPDADFARFVESGAGEAVKTPAQPVKSIRKAKSAAEVATSESVGVKPMKGG
jgi:hypothetical protein